IGEHRILRKQITFNEMIPLACDILASCSSARYSLRQTYSDVFLDEFQDCTDRQYELIKQAFLNTSTRLVAVGDTKQKIMGWAGALEGIFVNFANDFSAKPLNLYQNFRSLPRLRKVQNEMVKAIDPSAAILKNGIQGDDGIVGIHSFENDIEEAKSIADTITYFIENENVPLHEIAILCSKQPHLYARAIMEELTSREIPYRNEQDLQDLASEPIFRLLISFIAILIGTREPESWTGLKETLSPDQGDEASESVSRMWDAFISQEKNHFLKSPGFDTAWCSIKKMLRKMGSEALASLSHEYENRDYLKQLINETKTQLEKLFTSENTINNGDSLKRLSEDNAVRILTIHKCKGLEFDSVIVQGIEKETFWGDRSSETCAFFVAISRAKRRLHLTYVEQRATPTGATPREAANWRATRNPLNTFLQYVTPHLGGDP
ncbi:MAG: ATP-dependent helicase, partial [Pseudomonadales bacterium]|nr:ATP-dependent helicase [Pseudomonadales bacterium]